MIICYGPRSRAQISQWYFNLFCSLADGVLILDLNISDDYCRVEPKEHTDTSIFAVGTLVLSELYFRFHRAGVHELRGFAVPKFFSFFLFFFMKL